ncbi:HNH endonuclease [Romeria aff. gracilis LEGE 07310]|uniref:HNH endonuclease n=1 Tax=Vasconcelosia minhoensis LEGE 07310 TaxID=915328 RepID=A0A8J7AA59_9CYAN|nr:HNH endonuclease [Romeria aff. gracilis LEGE 07310]
MSEADKTLQSLFKLADKVGKRRYSRLTLQDFQEYRKFDVWRYINGKSECGITEESREWVRDNSESHCPICGERFSRHHKKTIDHKLPRAQYPWLSLDFRNLWVICYQCNQEKGERHWYEYEHYIFNQYPDRYEDIRFARPRQLLRSLKAE